MRKTKIRDWMTAFPHTIHSGMPLKTAKEMMRKFEIRHLPVQLAGHLVGVLSDRDLKLGASFDRDGKLLVEDVMTPDPYTVRADDPIREVAREMARHKFGCAIVQDKSGKVVGIFTATDALLALSQPGRPAIGKKQKAGANENRRSLD